MHASVALVTNVIAENVIYAGLIVPRLSTVQSVPLWWWAGMYLPVLLGCIWIGARVRGFRDAALQGVLVGVVVHAHKAVLASMMAPGHLKSTATEAPWEFWTVMLLRVCGGFVVVLCVVHVVTRTRHRTRRVV